MEHIDMVEKLRQKANVSYEEAKQALEKNEWDLLDALVYLEGQGKIKGEAQDTYTTRPEPRPEPQKEKDFRSVFSRIMRFLADLIDKGNKSMLHVSRRGKELFSLPLTVVALLMILGFWFLFWVMIAGFFFGLRYSISGPLGGKTVNKAMDKAAQAAESIKTGVSREDKPQENGK